MWKNLSHSEKGKYIPRADSWEVIKNKEFERWNQFEGSTFYLQRSIFSD